MLSPRRADAVDAKKVQAVAERLILDQDPAVAAYGETFYMNRYSDYNWIKRRTFMQRF